MHNLFSSMIANVASGAHTGIVSAPITAGYQFNWYELLSPAAILISACGAWWFANQSIKSSAASTRRKSTFDYISKLSWDKDYISAKEKFLEVKVGPRKISQVARDYEALKANADTGGAELDENQKRTLSEHSAIKNILNEYEAMAIAIKQEALDEVMMKENIRQQYVDHVDACREFIQVTRNVIAQKNSNSITDPDRIWCELQVLAQKWSN